MQKGLVTHHAWPNPPADRSTSENFPAKSIPKRGFFAPNLPYCQYRHQTTECLVKCPNHVSSSFNPHLLLFCGTFLHTLQKYSWYCTMNNSMTYSETSSVSWHIHEQNKYIFFTLFQWLTFTWSFWEVTWTYSIQWPHNFEIYLAQPIKLQQMCAGSVTWWLNQRWLSQLKSARASGHNMPLLL